MSIGVSYLVSCIFEVVSATDDLQCEDYDKKLSGHLIGNASYYLKNWCSYRADKKNKDLVNCSRNLVDTLDPFLGRSATVVTKENKEALFNSLKVALKEAKRFILKKAKKSIRKQVFGGWEVVTG